MSSHEYATSITPESQRVFEMSFDYYMSTGATFDAAMQTAIAEEQAFIEDCRRRAAVEAQED